MTPLVSIETGVWLQVVSLLHLTAFGLVTIHCLRHRREATSALLWIFVAWSFPLIGPLLYLYFGMNRVAAKGWHKQRSDQELLTERRRREEDAMPLAYWRVIRESLASEPTEPQARELNGAMDRVLTDYPLMKGNRVEPLISGDEAFPRMLEAIRGATHHVHLQTFIVGRDAVGREFLDLLAKKAREGVTVRFLYDRFGSTHALLGGLFHAYRRVPNLRLVGWTQVNPIKSQFQFNLRNHRKLLIVDGREAFMGGVNLQNDNVTRFGKPPIRDYHFAVTGPIVQELQYTFFRDWYYMTDEDPETLLSERYFPSIRPVGGALVRVINGGPTAELETMTDVFFSAMVSARRQLLAVTPYLVPTPDVLRALRSAALRGVDVRVVVPQDNNHIYAGLAGRALYEELLSAGVRVFERKKPFLHAKALLVDDALAIVGTANLDVRSLRLNYETNLAVFDEVFVNQLKRIILEDVAQSEELNLDVWRRRPARARLAENFCSLLTPIL